MNRFPHRLRVVIPATLNPQHFGGQPNSGLFKDFVICAANVIQKSTDYTTNKPVILNNSG